MKKNNSKLENAILITFGFVFLLSSCCLNKVALKNNNKREVIVYSNCSSKETSSDILYSIDQIKTQLEEKSIAIKIDKQRKQCGYLFIDGNKRKTITFTLTDLELIQEIKKFYSN